MMNSKTYADYIATRPRAERFGSHGLFTDDGISVNLSKVSEELNLQIVFWFHRFRKSDTNKLEHRSRLIDSFVNGIFLYDDKMIITFNYKDGTKTITFSDLEKSELGSDINGLRHIE